MLSRAPKLAEVENTVDESVSLIDVDSPHISSVPSDFTSQSVRTDTQAERLEREANELEERAVKRSKQAASEAKSAAKSAADLAEKNADNPVVIGNVVVVGALAAVFGTQIYKRWNQEGFSWSFFGLGLAAVGAIGAADYFVSRYVFVLRKTLRWLLV